MRWFTNYTDTLFERQKRWHKHFAILPKTIYVDSGYHTVWLEFVWRRWEAVDPYEDWEYKLI